MTAIETLSSFAAGLDYRKLPATVREQTGWILADTLAAIVAGSAEPEMQALTRRLRNAGGSTVLGHGCTASADVAALLNGTAGTFLEMDEGNRFSRGHPAIHVLPAALALCEQQGSDANVFLSALVVGYEVGSRIGAASRLRASMHPHGTWGTVGSAAACARVAGMDATAMAETISMGASMSTATSKRTMLEGGLVRNVYAGLSNRQGLLAVQLAESGFTGERDGVASLMGEIVSEHFEPQEMLRELGALWHLTQNYFKLHSCCRFNHGALDAIDQIELQGPLPEPAQIRAISVESYAYAAELDDPAPRNTLAARFSLPFAVATRIVNGNSRLESFSWNAVRDPRILELARRVAVREDPQMTLRLPRERPARVSIHLHDGRTLEAQVGVNRGDDALPYTREELRAKFMDLSGRVWPQDHAARVLQSTLALADGKTAFGDWVALLRQPPLQAA
jgi:2-methylcitrate dehydratase PrpD